MKKTRIEWEEGKRRDSYRYNPSDWKQEAAFLHHLEKSGWKVEEYTDGGYGGVWYDKKDIFLLQDETHSKPLAEFIEHESEIVSLSKDKRLEIFLKGYDFKKGLAGVRIRMDDPLHYQIWSNNSPEPPKLTYGWYYLD